jgi:Ankyrin repeats (3 copies)/Ankyrin repeat
LDRFRWVHSQLEALSQWESQGIRNILNEFPNGLYQTYEQALQRIAREKKELAHRLFQCLVAAVRPLRVDELAEMFAVELDPNSEPKLVEDWRPENPEEAVLSVCSTLIAIVGDDDSKIVRFSHFSVKDFLTSRRFGWTPQLEKSTGFLFYISLGAAHTMLTRACLTVVLQLDEKLNIEHLETSPFAAYATRHWTDHLATWFWIHDSWGIPTPNGLAECPSAPDASPLYYAALCGFLGLAKSLIATHGGDVHDKCGDRGTPLHAASYSGHVDVARLLLDHGAHANSSCGGTFPLRRAYDGRHPKVMRLLLEYGADVDIQDDTAFGTLLHDASFDGQTEIVDLLLQYDADVNARGFENQTALHMASCKGHFDIAQLLLEYGADVHAKNDSTETLLDYARRNERRQIVGVLLRYGAEPEEPQ